MDLDRQIENIEMVATHCIETKDKKSFTEFHAKIALSIYDELPGDLKSKFNYDASKIAEILRLTQPYEQTQGQPTNRIIKDSKRFEDLSDENIRLTTDFFSKMIILYANMQKKTKTEHKSIMDLFKGLFIFAVSIYVLWTIFFTLAFGFQQSSIISIVMSLLSAFLFFKIDKILEGGN